ncbi:MAG: hypothetical protein OEL89_02560 [Candidatus Peregrinibacteria bacterium]|nr:hypothetical protein [Candidatus Peregrinibacteria bacterium]
MKKMCDKLPYCNPRIDKCLKEIIQLINKSLHFRTIASCCGHGKYPTTIIIKAKNGVIFEFFTCILLRKRKKNRYYKKDLEGYYYIPEVLEKNL